jgi:hypothetical protein
MKFGFLSIIGLEGRRHSLPCLENAPARIYILIDENPCFHTISHSHHHLPSRPGGFILGIPGNASTPLRNKFIVKTQIRRIISYVLPFSTGTCAWGLTDVQTCNTAAHPTRGTKAFSHIASELNIVIKVE